MIDIDDLIPFLNEKCVVVNTHISFAAFHHAFKQWLPGDRRHESNPNELFDLMQEQDRFDLHVVSLRNGGRKVFVLKCAIPFEQTEMVGA